MNDCVTEFGPASAISRRRMLRGFGAVMALPWLPSLAPRSVSAAVEAGKGLPLRAAWLYVPNGVNVEQWMPTGSGRDYALSESLKVLEAQRGDFSVLSGLSHDKARAHGNGGGDHARATATYLTGCMPKKTAGADIRLGESVDQIAARQIGQQTRLSSLELSTDGQRTSGRCDSGYSCAYQFNLAWKSETMPMAPEMDPRLAFERLFGVGSLTLGTGPEAVRARKVRRSVLDSVMAEAKGLQKQAAPADRRKLEEYLDSVREMERRLERSESAATQVPVGAVPTGIPSRYEDHIRAMMDLMVLAFQTDSTRIITFLLAHDGSNRSFPDLGVAEAHHELSHHQKNPEKLKKIAEIDRFYLKQFGYLIEQLKRVEEGEGSLLDRSMIIYGGGICDGDRHNHDNLPILMAGGQASGLTHGRRMVLDGEVPMTNLHLAVLERLGAPAERIGDSTGKLELS
jgi:hypothetical protein